MSILNVPNITLKWCKYSVKRLYNLTSPPSAQMGSSETASCRSCSSFADYMKQSKRKYTEEKGDNEQKTQNLKNTVDSTIYYRDDCPVDREQLGRSTWDFLHTMAAKFPIRPSVQEKTEMYTFLQLFSKFYPCRYCAEDMRKEMTKEPPITDSQEALSQWLCRMHNKINIKLGKPVFDCSKVNERWRDGWLDGSCG